MNTPRETLFEEINAHWGINNKELARAIVKRDSATSGRSPLQLIEVRSSLSRSVVHVAPGENVYGWLAPYEQSVPRVMALLKRAKKLNGNDDILDKLTGDCAQSMRASLDAYGQDGALYQNTAARIRSGALASPADAAETALALFLVAGCAGNAREAARFVIDMMERLAMPAEMQTRFATDEETSAPLGNASHLGLYRLHDGKLAGTPHVLNESSEGTEIGSMSLASYSINDVGKGVSRRHARIWRDDAGAWQLEDLGSTNGTVVVRPDGRRVVVGAPKSAPVSQGASGPTSIAPGDRIVLAERTEFAVVELAARPQATS